MPSFGTRSVGKLETVDPGLVEICYRVIEVVDFTVVWGRRGQEAQNHCFEIGTSTKRWPDSNHNSEDPDALVTAIDLAPWFPKRPHIRWDQEREFIYLSGHMDQAAHELGIPLRWGGDWDQDDDLYDRNVPFDLGHFERISP